MLTGATAYHYRAVAFNVAGTNFGVNLTFTPPAPPVIVTDAASVITTNGATLNGQATPNFGATAVYFQWGTTPAFGNATAGQNIGEGATAVSVTAALTNLAPRTTCYFRLVGSNIAGTNNGATLSLTTLALISLFSCVTS